MNIANLGGPNFGSNAKEILGIGVTATGISGALSAPIIPTISSAVGTAASVAIAAAPIVVAGAAAVAVGVGVAKVIDKLTDD